MDRLDKELARAKLRVQAAKDKQESAGPKIKRLKLKHASDKNSGSSVQRDNVVEPLNDPTMKRMSQSQVQQLREELLQEDKDYDKDYETDERIEIVDEFGRTRLMRASEVSAHPMSGIPRVAKPERVIIGDVIQTGSFRLGQVLEDEQEFVHYDARSEVRDKGVGFYEFDRDEVQRQRQIQDIKASTIKPAEGSISKRLKELDARKELVQALATKQRARVNYEL